MYMRSKKDINSHSGGDAHRKLQDMIMTPLKFVEVEAKLSMYPDLYCMGDHSLCDKQCLKIFTKSVPFGEF